MQRTMPLSSTASAVAALICAAASSACGAGGDSADVATGTSTSASTGTGTSTDTATAYAANATLIASDAGSALDASVQTVQTLAATQAGATSSGGDVTALAVAPNAVVNVPLTCAGGGSATLGIAGGTPASILNGQFDAGEIYSVAFAACQGASGAVAVSGNLTLTVLSASATSRSLGLVASSLLVALPAGSATIDGSATQASTTGTAGGVTTTTSRLTSPSFTLAAQRNARSGRFTLSEVDISRASASTSGVLQSSSFSGTHTLAATLAAGAFSYTVATNGSVAYSAAGVPSSGAFTVTLPRTSIGVSVASGNATVTVDDGRDGTIDRSVVVPLGALQADAN